MPMIDVVIPSGALEPSAEQRLLEELSDILIRLEGFDPADERARAVTWTFLHRAEVRVAGSPAVEPRYRVIPSVAEGLYDDATREAVVREVTEAIARAEGASFEDVSRRVWVFPTEVPDGTWGGRGRVHRLPDIVANLEGEYARPVAERRLASRRRRRAIDLLGAAARSPASCHPADVAARIGPVNRLDRDPCA